MTIAMCYSSSTMPCPERVTRSRLQAACIAFSHAVLGQIFLMNSIKQKLVIFPWDCATSSLPKEMFGKARWWSPRRSGRYNAVHLPSMRCTWPRTCRKVQQVVADACKRQSAFASDAETQRLKRGATPKMKSLGQSADRPWLANGHRRSSKFECRRAGQGARVLWHRTQMLKRIFRLAGKGGT